MLSRPIFTYNWSLHYRKFGISSHCSYNSSNSVRLWYVWNPIRWLLHGWARRMLKTSFNLFPGNVPVREHSVSSEFLNRLARKKVENHFLSVQGLLLTATDLTNWNEIIYLIFLLDLWLSIETFITMFNISHVSIRSFCTAHFHHR